MSDPDRAEERLARWRRQAEADRAAWETLRAAQRGPGARSRPADALDARTALVETLRSAKGVRFGTIAYHGVPEARAQLPAGGGPLVDDELIAGSPDAVRALAERLAAAAVYWVAPDMIDIVEAAAATMPDQPVLATDLPAPMGFAWLPFTAGDRGGNSSLRALAWDLEVAGADRLRISVFTDRADWLRQTRQPDPGPNVGFALFPSRWHDWTLGRAWEAAYALDGQRPETGPVHLRPAWVWLRRFCQALWTLMAEPYVEVTAGHAERPVVRRAQRAGTTAEGLRVVTLRRPRHPSPGDDTSRQVEWSHRWVVSGHWRRQWDPSIAEHRLRYILPYLKGPDDKPVVVKDTVFALRR